MQRYSLRSCLQIQNIVCSLIMRCAHMRCMGWHTKRSSSLIRVNCGLVGYGMDIEVEDGERTQNNPIERHRWTINKVVIDWLIWHHIIYLHVYVLSNQLKSTVVIGKVDFIKQIAWNGNAILSLVQPDCRLSNLKWLGSFWQKRWNDSHPGERWAVAIPLIIIVM